MPVYDRREAPPSLRPPPVAADADAEMKRGLQHLRLLAVNQRSAGASPDGGGAEQAEQIALKPVVLRKPVLD